MKYKKNTLIGAKPLKELSMKLGIIEVLTIVFIVLKLCNVITWSWAIVLSPLWIGFLVDLIFVIVTWVYELIVSTYM
jgi:hypothetical protein